MDIVDLVKADQAAISSLLDRLEHIAKNPTEDVEDLLNDLAMDLKVLFRSEEKVLYHDCLKSREGLHDLALKGRMEHKLIEVLVSHLLRNQPDSEGRFNASVEVLKDLFNHHVAQTNDELLPQVSQAFSPEERELMNGRMQFSKEKFRDRLVKKRRLSGPAGMRRKEMRSIHIHR